MTSRYLLPLSTWYDIGATVVVLLLAALLLGAMFFFIRIASDDSDKYKTLREMVETLFGTPAHLRSGDASSDDAASSATAPSRPSTLPFREPCPACNTEVTERDAECPSCQLRLL
ncbi:hypothetical protein M6D81_31155 [Paenibacillus sp. J5C_2022]|uniref:hypothetical protein n=1 Tax=Paenibacillus sp. J5C2022 TaxID=2977129 RepID=UPI0021CF51EF|nr:hypothetical protein [Paenibacillus sp. J5C2022]MCU6713166.1 hypothetical protein [Paenibacillus sp. J5C2022]